MHSCTTKTKVFALAGLLAMANAHAEVTLAEGLTASGFIDMSILSVDGKDSTETSMGWDQWEIDFAYDYGSGLKAFVDLNDTGEGAEVEQAYILADLGNGSRRYRADRRE